MNAMDKRRQGVNNELARKRDEANGNTHKKRRMETE